MTTIRRTFAFASIALVTTALADDGAPVNNCSVTASLDYFQRGAEAQVETTIENYDCGASRGTYVIEATIRADDADGPEKLKFSESWERNDDQSVVISKRYPIGDDVDLVRIKIRKLKCACAAADEPVSSP